MISKSILESIEDILNSSGHPVYCFEYDGYPDDEVKAANKLLMVFQENTEQELFKALSENKKSIYELFGGEAFYIKPITTHYYFIKKVLGEVCPDSKLYYFSPQKGERRVIEESGKKILSVSLKLLLIKKGNVANVPALEESLKERVASFNADSKYVKVTRIDLADKDDPFGVAGEEIDYRKLTP